MNLDRSNSLLRRLGDSLRSPLLLAIRLYWGIQFFHTGLGKFMHLSQTAEYFASLHIPLPHANAVAAASVELVCGLLLALGLWSRPACLPLIGTMCVAYATAERDALNALWTNPDTFTAATPFLFLLATVIVFVFGPGNWSLDHAREHFYARGKQT